MKRSEEKKRNDAELIRGAIERLQANASSDYESLIREVEDRRHVLQLNLPQLVASRSLSRILVMEWARGTGKTTFLGLRLKQLIESMPRSTGLFIGPTYKLILTRILPSLIQGLELVGLYENLHYFIGQQPPRSWRSSWGRPNQPPRDYGRCIIFWNGTIIHLVSQDVPGDGRGLNSDWIVGDEAALLSKDKMEQNTDPTLRGTNTDLYKSEPLFGSKTYMSSTPLTQEGSWMLEFEEKAISKPSEVNFISADCRENLHNLRPGYLKDARLSSLATWVFLAEYFNVRPKMIKDGFYPLLDAQAHGYDAYDYNHYQKVGQASDCRGDGDLVKGQPIILGVDWGASINCLTANQHLRSLNEYRTLKDFYVLGADQKTQDDMFSKFHEYYKYHQSSCKDISLYCDASGTHKTGITKLTRAQLAQRQLTDLGWNVQIRTLTGSNPLHEAKYLLWNMLLSGQHADTFPSYRINRSNARDTWVSMRYARAKKSRTGSIQKDKSSERSNSIPRQHATDLSDANDSPLYGLFSHLLRYVGASVGLPGAHAS
ncbi:MAG: hypothetical protein KDD28_27005 [Phaeodactylibacter sp.]|nr:hypothetical protein [Phaeodactylibacter sp.]